jgi:predicted metal-dependent hydrolase
MPVVQESAGLGNYNRLSLKLMNKTARISRLVQSLESRDFDPHYLGFFECFNRQRFFEAHEVLESLWLPERSRPNGNFYKALIQLAGAFVHLQKARSGPATALFNLAQRNLCAYGARHESLDLEEVRDLISAWLRRLETSKPEGLAFEAQDAPRLELSLG